MGIFTKDIKTMEDMFLHQLEDIYYAEQQLTKAIPKMVEMATNADLKAGLNLTSSTPKIRLSVSTRSLLNWAATPKAPIAQRSMVSSRKQMIRQERSKIKPYSTRPLSPTLRPWSTTKYRDTAHSLRGLKSWGTTTLFAF